MEQRTAELINAEVDRLNSFVVQGQVRRTDGSPAVGFVVRAFDQDPQQGEVSLGGAATNDDGVYEIRYTSKQFDN